MGLIWAGDRQTGKEIDEQQTFQIRCYYDNSRYSEFNFKLLMTYRNQNNELGGRSPHLQEVLTDSTRNAGRYNYWHSMLESLC